MQPHRKTPQDVISETATVLRAADTGAARKDALQFLTRAAESGPAYDPLPPVDEPRAVDYVCASGHMVMAMTARGGDFADLEGTICPICLGSVTAASDVVAVLNQRRLSALTLRRVRPQLEDQLQPHPAREECPLKVYGLPCATCGGEETPDGTEPDGSL